MVIIAVPGSQAAGADRGHQAPIDRADVLRTLYGPGFSIYSKMLGDNAGTKLAKLAAGKPPVNWFSRKSHDISGLSCAKDPPARWWDKRWMSLDKDFQLAEAGPPFKRRKQEPELDEDSLWRFDLQTAVAKNLLARSGHEALPTQVQHLQCHNWNSGKYRGKQAGCWEGFRGGAAHIVIGQEFDADDSEQAAMLRSMGFSVVTEEGLLIGCREHLVKSMEVLWAEYKATYFAALIVRIVLAVPVMGLAHIVVASVHLNNDRAKRPEACRTMATTIYTKFAEHAVDLCGYDLNMGVQVFSRELTQVGGGLNLRTPPADCTGFLVPRISSLLARPLRSFKYYNILHSDFGIGAKDGDSHWLSSAIWGGAHTRDPATAAAAAARQQAARKARKAEAKRAGK